MSYIISLDFPLDLHTKLAAKNVQKTSFIVLIICIIFSFEGYCQNLTLKIKGQTTDETAIIESLTYLKNHKNFISIKSELDSIQNKLFKIGYIENKASKIEKINDTTFHSKIHLKNK